MVAKSLAQAAKRGQTVTHLHLKSSSDLVCMNLMCEKVGGVRGGKRCVHIRAGHQLSHTCVALPPAMCMPPRTLPAAHTASTGHRCVWQCAGDVAGHDW